MDFNNPAISYLFLIIPGILVLVVVGQGISKVLRNEEDGFVALGFGVFLVVLIGVAYWVYIR